MKRRGETRCAVVFFAVQPGYHGKDSAKAGGEFEPGALFLLSVGVSTCVLPTYLATIDAGVLCFRWLYSGVAGGYKV